MIAYKLNPALNFVKDYKGNPFKNGQYYFGEEPMELPRSTIFKWMLSPNPYRKEKREDKWAPYVQPLAALPEKHISCIIWLGHASFLIQTGGYRIITDPVFFDLAPVMRRRHALPISVDKLTQIDYLLLSHGHRDHLDIPSLKKLLPLNPAIKVLCPLGFEAMLKDIGFEFIQEAAWYQQYQTPENLKIVFLPAKHWNRRFLWDYNTTLWGSHWIESNETTIYFAGDTAMADHFKDIRATLGAPDISLLPVGAYLPRFVMEWAHIAPWEALEAFKILESSTFIPMHYGTFDLSEEPASAPLQLLRKYHLEGQFDNKVLLTPDAGEIIDIKTKKDTIEVPYSDIQEKI